MSMVSTFSLWPLAAGIESHKAGYNGLSSFVAKHSIAKTMPKPKPWTFLILLHPEAQC